MSRNVREKENFILLDLQDRNLADSYYIDKVHLHYTEIPPEHLS